MTQATTASAARPLPDTLFDVAYRPPAQPRHDFQPRHTMAGYTPAQALDVVVQALGVKPTQIAAVQTDTPARCWIVLAPAGRRLARIDGMDAADANLALADIDAGRFQRIAA